MRWEQGGQEMSGMSAEYGTPGVAERLSAIRTPQAQPAATVTPRKIRSEFIIGVLIILVGVALAFLFLGKPSVPATVVSIPGAEISAVASESGALMTGEAFVAISVPVGNFPPKIKVGNSVRAVVTPSSDGSGTVRMLRDVLLVQAVDSPTDIGTSHVVTVRAPEAVAISLAASGPIHLVVVGSK
jgi:hypothetical protein